MAYQFDALVDIFFSTSVWVFFTVFSTVVLTGKTGGIYSWSRNEIILLACLYNIFVGVFSSIFTPNINEFSNLVLKGLLDSYLLKPIDSQWNVSLSKISFTSLFRTLLGLIITVIFVIQAKIVIQPLDIFYCVILFMVAQVLLYSCLFIINTILIWAPRIDNISEIFYTLRSLGRYSPDVFERANIVVFFVLLPFIIILATPAKVLLHRASMFDVIQLIVMTIVFFSLSRLFWKFALRNYTSASS